MTKTKNAPTYPWTPAEIAAAHGAAMLLWAPLSREAAAELQQLSPEVRRAARTIADLIMPLAFRRPADPPVGDLLPRADALAVMAGGEGWAGLETAAAEGLAMEYLHDLARCYDVRDLTAGDVIAAGVSVAEQA